MQDILETIRLNLLEALRAIQTANDFSFDAFVEARKSANTGGNNPRPGLLILAQDRDEPAPTSAAAGFRRLHQHYILTAYVIESDQSPEDIDAAANRCRADVWKALQVDTQRGGVAFQTIYESCEQFKQGSLEGFDLMFYVDYDHLYTDPYAQTNS